jgi:NADP-dependent 3-hydroxy acid dehydrogenase YdfG
VFLEPLVADGGGDLINVSSVAGWTVRAGNAVYPATESIAAQDIAEIVSFAVSRPRGVSLSEILVCPTGQAG